MNGIEKEIDGLGRIVLPLHFRKKLNLRSGSRVRISAVREGLLIAPVGQVCVLCESVSETPLTMRLCKECIEKVKGLK